MAREFDPAGLAGPLTVAAGVEARRESYAIGAGEEGSVRGMSEQKGLHGSNGCSYRFTRGHRVALPGFRQQPVDE
jgi:hypothetical protein